MANRILVLGVDSKIGSALYKDLNKNTSFNVYGTSRRKDREEKKIFFLDIYKYNEKNLEFSEFDTLIFCAGITSTEMCQKNYKFCYENKC